MGQHKIPGASKGSDYKKDQTVHKRVYAPDKRQITTNVPFLMLNNKRYYYDDKGDLRKVNV